MEPSRSCRAPALLLSLVTLATLMASPSAYVFYVGGRDGWVQNPSESYTSWASRNRFQINDTLVFKYNKSVDSVLVVSNEAYDACNVSEPVQSMDTGDDAFRLDRSGPFYFISGSSNRCANGEKLVVVVLAVRNKPPAPSTPAAPSLAPSPSPKPPVTSPPLSPPAPSPASPSPSSSAAPTSSPPSPASPSPSSSASPIPSPITSPTTSPVSSPPASAPSPAPNSGGTTTPTPSTSPTATPTPSPPSPNAGTPTGPSAGPGGPGGGGGGGGGGVSPSAVSPPSPPSSASYGLKISAFKFAFLPVLLSMVII